MSGNAQPPVDIEMIEHMLAADAAGARFLAAYAARARAEERRDIACEISRETSRLRRGLANANHGGTIGLIGRFPFEVAGEAAAEAAPPIANKMLRACLETLTRLEATAQPEPALDGAVRAVLTAACSDDGRGMEAVLAELAAALGRPARAQLSLASTRLPTNSIAAAAQPKPSA